MRRDIRYTFYMIGKRHSRLVVIEHYRKNGYTRSICRCDCGNTIDTAASNVTSGKTQSCGCLQKERRHRPNPAWTTHGVVRDGHRRLYSTWKNMLKRCNDPESPKYASYGGRRVSVCEAWHDVRTFVDWAIASGYQPGLTLERINVLGNYEPSNCKWITMSEQQRNKRNTLYYEAFGETKAFYEWQRDPRWAHGLSVSTFNVRFQRNKWDIERAISTPVRPCVRTR